MPALAAVSAQPARPKGACDAWSWCDWWLGCVHGNPSVGLGDPRVVRVAPYPGAISTCPEHDHAGSRLAIVRQPHELGYGPSGERDQGHEPPPTGQAVELP